MRFAKSPRFSSSKHGSPNGFALLAAMLSLLQRLHPKVACCLIQCTKQPDCILDTRRYGMANPWRKALSSFLSIVLVAGLLPCVSFYGSAWASDAEGEGSAVEAAQVEEGASTADSALAADAAQASESTRLAAVAQPTDSTQLASAAQPTTDAVAQSSTETLPFGNTISAAGEDHSAAITSNGELWIWGRNSVFQLGYSSGDEKKLLSEQAHGQCCECCSRYEFFGCCQK